MTAPAASPRVAINPWLVALGGLCAMAAAVGIGRFIYTPILPAMVADLGLTQADAGFIAAANFVGYLLGALAGSSRLLAGDPRRWLIGGLMASAATTAGMAAAVTLSGFIALRLVGGFASAIVLVFASALVLERLAEAGRSSLSIVHFAGVGCGIVLSAAVTWSVTGIDGGWQDMWLWGGFAAAVAALAVAVSVPSRPPSGPARSSTDALIMTRRLWYLTGAYGLFGFGYVVTATFIVAIVRASTLPQEVEPVIWLVVGLSAIPSVALWLRLAEAWGVLVTFAVACLVEAVGVAVSVMPLPEHLGLLGLLAAAVLLGGTFIGITALGLIGAREAAGAAARRAVALVTAAFGLGQIVGPVVAGWGHELTGSFLAPSLVAASALLLAAILAVAAARTPT